MPTAFEIETMNEQNCETELVTIKAFAFAKPRPMGRIVYPPSARTRMFIFVVDPSTYDQVIEPDAENEFGGSSTLLPAAEQDFEALCCFDDGGITLIMLKFHCCDSFRTMLARISFRYYYSG